MTEPMQDKKPASDLALMKRDVVDVVATRINEMLGSGSLQVPPGYSPENALKSAWLVLQNVEDKEKNKALAVCTKDSIANALLDMVVQGLSPQRDQCYFVVYGKRLTLLRSYFGSIALLRRIYGPQVQVWDEVVYEGDEFAYEIVNGRKRVTKHVQSLANVGKKIVGAYATIDCGNGREPVTEVMTWDQIVKAWEQGQTKGGSPAHNKFPDKMACKTVINRAARPLINAADDSFLKRAIERQEVSGVAAAVAEEIEGVDAEEVDLNADPRTQPAEVGDPGEATPKARAPF